MKTWIVRFTSLFVFNIAVLIAIGLFTPAKVGWSVIWASLVMTALVLFVKPVAEKWARKKVEQTRQGRSRAREQLVQFLVVLALAGGVWVATLMLTGVNAGDSWFWAFVLPPFIIAVGWWVYALVSDRIEAKAGELYDRIGSGEKVDAPASPSAAEQTGRAELADGLTPEQRKLLNDL
jgi:hypothetical protein